MSNENILRWQEDGMLGDAESCYRMGRAYLEGIVVDIDYYLAEAWLKEAVRLGYRAQRSLAIAKQKINST